MINLTDKNHFKFLKEVSIFKKLTEDELRFIIDFLQIKEIDENETVFSRFQMEQVLYIVRYGELKLELLGSNDVIYKRGDVFGEIAILNEHYRAATMTAKEASVLLALKGTDLLNGERIPASISIKIIIQLAKLITSYLATAENTSTYKIIESGENDYVEFKSTLRYNLFTNKFDKEIEHASLKTIAAFMNSAGGTLLIGVDDHKKLLGLREDNFQDHDKLLLYLTRLIQDRIGMQHPAFVRAAVEAQNGSELIRVDVTPSTLPAYLKHQNEEHFYVRSGPSSSQLKVSDIYEYIHNRFYTS